MTTLSNQLTILQLKYGDNSDKTRAEMKTAIKNAESTYGLSLLDARKSVETSIAQSTNSTDLIPVEPEKDTLLTNIQSDGTWLNAIVEIREIWEPSDDNIAYAGLVEDTTGIKKFILWNEAREHLTEREEHAFQKESKIYAKDIVTKPFNNKIELKFNKQTKIIPLDGGITPEFSIIQGTIRNVKDVRLESVRCPANKCNHDIHPSNLPRSKTNFNCSNGNKVTKIPLSNLEITATIIVGSKSDSTKITLLSNETKKLLRKSIPHNDQAKKINLPPSKLESVIENGHNKKKLKIGEIPHEQIRLNRLIGRKAKIKIDDRYRNILKSDGFEILNQDKRRDDILVESREIQAALKQLSS